MAGEPVANVKIPKACGAKAGLSGKVKTLAEAFDPSRLSKEPERFNPCTRQFL